MPEGKPMCFVISPIRIDRAEKIYNTIITQSCILLGFEAYRADLGSSEIITKDIFDKLETSKAAIAYLGKPETFNEKEYWNANVMFEIGYRKGLDKSIVILCESAVDNKDILPFDLKDFRAIPLPREEEVDPTGLKYKGIVDSVVEQLKQYAGSPGIVDPWFRPTIGVTTSPGMEPIIEEVSDKAATMFNVDRERLKGMNLIGYRKFVLKKMPREQRQAFDDEQHQLHGRLYHGEKELSAKVCIVLPRHGAGARGKKFNAYLPFILNRTTVDDRKTRITVTYIDVTMAAKKDDDGVYRCEL